MENQHANNRVERLKKRSKYCVCKFCGGELTLKQIVFSDVNDAKVELYCKHCDKIEFGVEKEIYTSACNFVDRLEFDYYDGMDDNEKKRQMNVAKVCEILGWGCKNMGILGEEGFTVPLAMENAFSAECLVLPSDEVVLAEKE